MRSLTSLFTVICYFLVTFLEKGAIVLCVLVSCGISEPVEAEMVPTDCSSCCIPQSACGSVISSAPAPIKIIEEKSCQIFMETVVSFKNRCECSLNQPHMTATHEQHKTENYSLKNIRSEKIYCMCDLSANLLIDSSLPRGVHFIIPSTVLLI